MATSKETIKTYLKRYLSTTLNVAQDSESLQANGESLFDKIKQVVIISLLMDENSIFWLTKLAADKTKESASDIRDALDSMLTTEGLFGIASNTVDVLSSTEDLEKAAFSATMVAFSPSKENAKEATNNLSKFRREALIQLMGMGNTVNSVGTVESLSKKANSNWDTFKTSVNKVFSTVENTSITDLAAAAVTDIAAKIADDLNIIIDAVTGDITVLESAQGQLSEQLLNMTLSSEGVLKMFYENVVDPIGTTLLHPAIGEVPYVSDELTGIGSMLPATYVAKSSEGRVFMDTVYASVTGSTPALTNVQKRATLLSNKGAPYDLSAFTTSGIVIKLEADGVIITHNVQGSEVSDTAIVANPASATMSEIINLLDGINATTVVNVGSYTETEYWPAQVGGVDLQGVSRFAIYTTSENMADSKLKILSGTTTGFLKELGIEAGTSVTGRTQVYTVTDSAVDGTTGKRFDTKLTAYPDDDEWPKYMITNINTASHYRVTKPTALSLSLKMPISPGATSATYYITNNVVGRFIYSRSDLRRPPTLDDPDGKVLDKGALWSGQGGHWIDKGSSGEIETSLLQDPMQPRASRGGTGQSVGTQGWWHPPIKTHSETCSHAIVSGASGVCGPVKARGIRGMTRAPLGMGSGQLGEDIGTIKRCSLGSTVAADYDSSTVWGQYLKKGIRFATGSGGHQAEFPHDFNFYSVKIGDYLTIIGQDNPTNTYSFSYADNPTKTSEYNGGANDSESRIMQASYRIQGFHQWYPHQPSKMALEVLPMARSGVGLVNQSHEVGSLDLYSWFDDTDTAGVDMGGGDFGLKKWFFEDITTRIVLAHKFIDDDVDFFKMGVAPGDYIMIWPSEEKNTVTSLHERTDMVAHRLKVFEIAGIQDSNTLMLNTGWWENPTANEGETSGPVFNTPYYDTGPGNIPYRVLERDDTHGHSTPAGDAIWPVDDTAKVKVNNDHIYFVMKRGEQDTFTFKHNLGDVSFAHLDYYYRFHSPSFTQNSTDATIMETGTINNFSDAGVAVGDILEITESTIDGSNTSPGSITHTNYPDTNQYQITGVGTLSSGLQNSASGYATKFVVTAVGANKDIFCHVLTETNSAYNFNVFATRTVRFNGTGNRTMIRGFDHWCFDLDFDVYREDYESLFFDKNATFLADNIEKDMLLVITAGPNAGTYTIESVESDTLLKITTSFSSPKSTGTNYYVTFSANNTQKVYAKNSDFYKDGVLVGDVLWLAQGGSNTIITEHTITEVVSKDVLKFDTAISATQLGFTDKSFMIVQGAESDGKTYTKQFVQHVQTEDWSSFTDTDIGGTGGLKSLVEFQDYHTDVVLRSANVPITQSGALSSADLPSGNIVAWYRSEELTNTTETVTTTTTHTDYNALYFTHKGSLHGSHNTYLDAPLNNITFQEGTGWTLAFWARIPAISEFGGGNDQTILTIWDDADSYPGQSQKKYIFRMFIKDSTWEELTVDLRFVNSANNNMTAHNLFFREGQVSQGTPAFRGAHAGTWKHFVFTFTGQAYQFENQFKVYVNGSLKTPDAYQNRDNHAPGGVSTVPSGSKKFTFFSPNSPFSGNTSGSTGDCHAWRFNEMAIWDDHFDQAKVDKIYNNGDFIPFDQAGAGAPDHRWSFDEGGGTEIVTDSMTIKDLKGNADLTSTFPGIQHAAEFINAAGPNGTTYTTTTTTTYNYIASWPDYSGNDNTALQTDKEKGPTYNAAALNSLATATFDGVDDFMTIANDTTLDRNINSGSTFAIVMKPLSTPGAEKIVFTKGDTTFQYRMLYGDPTDAFRQRTNHSNNSYNVHTTSGIYSPNSWYIVVMSTKSLDSGEGAKMTFDGSPNGTNPGSIRVGDVVTDDLTLGAKSDGTDGLSFEVAEIIFFDASLTDADRSFVEGYLAHKFGLAGNLFSTHNYHTAPPVSVQPGSGVIERNVLFEGGQFSHEDYTAAQGDTVVVDEKVEAGGYTIYYDGAASKLKLVPNVVGGWALFAGTSSRRLYDASANFTDDDIGTELILYPGAANEHRSPIIARIDANTVEFGDGYPADADTGVVAPFGKTGVHYALLPPTYPTPGMLVIGDNFKSRITAVKKVTNNGQNNLLNNMVVLEVDPPAPWAKVNSTSAHPKPFYVVNSTLQKTSTFKALTITDETGANVADGFESYKEEELVGASFQIDLPGSKDSTVASIRSNNEIVIDGLYEHSSTAQWRIRTGLPGSSLNVNAHTSHNLSAVGSGDLISMWGIRHPAPIDSTSGSKIMLQSPMRSGVSDYYTITKSETNKGAEYYGHYVIYKYIVTNLALPTNLVGLSLLLNEAITDRGTDYAIVKSSGASNGVTTVATAFDKSTALATESFAISDGATDLSSLSSGTRLKIFYLDRGTGKYSYSYSWIKDLGANNKTCTLFIKIPTTDTSTSDGRIIVGWEASEGSATIAAKEAYALRQKLDTFIQYTEGYTPPASEGIRGAIGILRDQGMDRALDILKSADINKFLTLTDETASYAGNAQKAMTEFGSGVEKNYE